MGFEKPIAVILTEIQKKIIAHSYICSKKFGDTYENGFVACVF